MMKRLLDNIPFKKLNWTQEWVDVVKTTHANPKRMLLLAAILVFSLAQAAAWFQINGQFINEWCKKHPMILSLLGIPISYFLILGTQLAFEGLDHKAWPGRLLAFACGMLIFTVLTYYLLGEALTWKTIVSIVLTLIIIVLQVV